MRGVLSSVDLDDTSLVAKAKASPGLVGRDLVREVIPDHAVEWEAGVEPLGAIVSRSRAVEDARGQCAARGGHRLWHEVEHRPAPVRHGLSRDDPARYGDRRRSAPMRARRRVPFQRPRRPRAVGLRPADDSRPLRARSPFSASAWGTNSWRLACGAKTYKLKFGHRGANQPVLRLCHGSRRDHHPEPRFCRGRGLLARRVGGDAPEPERQHGRGRSASDPSGLQRAVSSGSVRRPA